MRLQETDPTELKPVFSDGDVSYVYVQHNNIYLVALTRRNANVTSVFVFLERLIEILKEYFGTLEEVSMGMGRRCRSGVALDRSGTCQHSPPLTAATPNPPRTHSTHPAPPRRSPSGTTSC